MDIRPRIAELIDAGCPFVAALMLLADGSTPCKAGARAVIKRSGAILGAVGGGQVEAEPRLVETCPAAGGKVTVEFLCDPYHEDPAPARVREEHGYMSLPLLVRPNTRLPMGARDDRPDYDYEDGVAVRKFEVKET